jgi:hypothetical protein
MNASDAATTATPTIGTPGDRGGAIQWLGLGLVVILSCVLRFSIAQIPLERDEGEYAYIADRWLAGDVPYRDAFDQKPPGVFLAYAALFAIGLRSIEAIHWLGHLFVLATAGLVYLVGRRLFSPVVGLAAALAMIVLVMDVSVLGNAANTEVFAILPLTAGMYLAVRLRDLRSRLGATPSLQPQRREFCDAALLGCMGGLAVLFKQVALPIVLFQFVAAMWRPGVPTRTSGLLATPLAMLAGFIAVLGLTCIYFASCGAWGPFVECVWSHNLAYSGRVSLDLYGFMFWRIARGLGLSQWPLLVAAGVGVWQAAVRRDGAVRPALWWWLSSLVAVSVGGYFRHHYFILVMPPTALVAGYGLEALSRIVEPKRREWQSRVAVVLSVLAVAWPTYLHRHYFFTSSPQSACRLLYGPNPFAESIELAALIRENSTPDDRVFVFGSEPQLLFYAGRRSASRYIFMYPLFGGSPNAPQRHQEVIAELDQHKPKFIVMVHVPQSFAMYDGDSELLLDNLTKRIEDGYELFANAILVHTGAFRVERARKNPDGSIAPPMIGPHESATVQVWERRN